MRLARAWLFVLSALFSACGSSPSAPTVPGAAPPQRLGVLGDSLAVSPSIEQAFPARLQARLDEQRLPWTVVNAGVSGDTTADGLRRAPQMLAGDIALLVVELGANDGLRGLPIGMIADNLAAIIGEAQRRNVRVLLCGMETPPTHGLDYSIAFHQIYPNVAARTSVPLVPFLLAGIAFDPRFTGPDGIHPNAAGAERIVDTVWPYLRPLLSVPYATTRVGSATTKISTIVSPMTFNPRIDIS
jgi:acyl-CoA thioesterase I